MVLMSEFRQRQTTFCTFEVHMSNKKNNRLMLRAKL